MEIDFSGIREIWNRITKWHADAARRQGEIVLDLLKPCEICGRTKACNYPHICNNTFSGGIAGAVDISANEKDSERIREIVFGSKDEHNP